VGNEDVSRLDSVGVRVHARNAPAGVILDIEEPGEGGAASAADRFVAQTAGLQVVNVRRTHKERDKPSTLCASSQAHAKRDSLPG
jgi:hypothetical protein